MTDHIISHTGYAKQSTLHHRTLDLFLLSLTQHPCARWPTLDLLRVFQKILCLAGLHFRFGKLYTCEQKRGLGCVRDRNARYQNQSITKYITNIHANTCKHVHTHNIPRVQHAPPPTCLSSAVAYRPQSLCVSAAPPSGWYGS